MCRLKAHTIENQMKMNSKDIETFEQKLLGLYSRLHKMKATQAELQSQLHEEQREYLNEVLPAKGKRGVRIPKLLTVAKALERLKWNPEAVKAALEANLSWKTKEIRL